MESRPKGHCMDARSLAATLILFASGCQHIRRNEIATYQTVQASPHRDTDSALAETNRAEGLLIEGEFDQAEQALQMALIADVSYGPAHNNLGNLYFSQGNYYLAAWEFEYATRLMPERPEPLNNLGLVYENTGKLDEAINFFEMAHDLQPDVAQYLGNLVRGRLRRGDRDEETQQLLSDLVSRETRPEWSCWAQEELALFPHSSGTVPAANFGRPLGSGAEELLPSPATQLSR